MGKQVYLSTQAIKDLELVRDILIGELSSEEEDAAFRTIVRDWNLSDLVAYAALSARLRRSVEL